MAQGNRPNEAARHAHERMGEGERQMRSFVRAMTRRRHASPDETKALADLVNSMTWSRKVA